MSDARWSNIEDDVSASIEHFAMAATLFESGGFDDTGREGYVARMAFLHAMQSGHTSLEVALLRILDILLEQQPTGSSWHKDLITSACREQSGGNRRPPILSEKLCEAADETRAFRNVAMRAYNSFRPKKAVDAVKAARFIADHLAHEIAEFKRVIDPD